MRLGWNVPGPFCRPVSHRGPPRSSEKPHRIVSPPSPSRLIPLCLLGARDPLTPVSGPHEEGGKNTFTPDSPWLSRDLGASRPGLYVRRSWVGVPPGSLSNALEDTAARKRGHDPTKTYSPQVGERVLRLEIGHQGVDSPGDLAAEAQPRRLNRKAETESMPPGLSERMEESPAGWRRPSSGDGGLMARSEEAPGQSTS